MNWPNGSSPFLNFIFECWGTLALRATRKPIVCWRKLAEFAGQYLAKGRLVYVAGRLTYRSWEDRDGQKRKTTEIVATELIPLDRRTETEGLDPDEGGQEDETPF